MADDDRWGSHVDRINPGENPAEISGIWIGPHPINKNRIAYRLTKPANVHGVILYPGTTVMLSRAELRDPALKDKIERVEPVTQASEDPPGRSPRR